MLSCALVISGQVIAQATEPTYDHEVLAVFQQACLNCHNPDKAKAGLDLSTYRGTLKGGSGGKIVEPGDVNSRLIAVVSGAAEPKMPPEGERLLPSQVSVLQEWIRSGLKENPQSAAKRASASRALAMRITAPATAGEVPMPQELLLEPSCVTSRGSVLRAMSLSPTAPLLAVSSQQQVLLVDTTKAELCGVLAFPEGEPQSLSFTPDGRFLLVAGGVQGKSGSMVLFDVVRGTRAAVVGREVDVILSADARPQLDVFFSGSPSRLLKAWQSGQDDPLRVVKKHPDWLVALDVSPDGVLLATGDRVGGVMTWEAQSGAEYFPLRGHQAMITGLAFRPDSNVLASASEDKSVRIWDMQDGKQVKQWDAHGGGVTALAWSADGGLATVGRDRRLKLWKADFSLLRDEALDQIVPTAVAWDVARKRVIVGDISGRVRFFDTEIGKWVAEMSNQPPSIAQRLQQLGAELQQLKDALTSANADPAVEQQRQQHQQMLEAQWKRWNTASLQLVLHHEREREQQLASENEERIEQFSESCRQLANLREEWLAVRQRVRAWRAHDTPWQGEETDEFHAMQAASLIRWQCLQERLHQLEQEIVQRRRAIDGAAQQQAEQQRRTRESEQRYRQSLAG